MLKVEGESFWDDAVLAAAVVVATFVRPTNPPDVVVVVVVEPAPPFAPVSAFDCADEAGLGKLKAVADFVSGFDVSVPPGTMAAVEIGVVLTVVVVVEELRDARLPAEDVTTTTGATASTSSAWITTSGLILLSAERPTSNGIIIAQDS